MKRLILLVALAALSACSQGAEEKNPVVADTETAAETPVPGPAATHSHADFAGEWFGPEGLFVEVALDGPGAYRLTMAADLDAPAEGVAYQGRDAEGGIAFVRDGQTMLLKRATGDETGLKYLEGETDCLMVQEGEGFCRKPS